MTRKKLITKKKGGKRPGPRAKGRRSRPDPNPRPEAPGPSPSPIAAVEPVLEALLIPIADLTVDPSNARTHEDDNLDAIRRSLEGFRQQKPIVVDQAGLVLAGNGTLAAAVALGWTHIAAVRSSLDPQQARAYAIADNRTTDLSGWDDRRLGEHLEALRQDDGIDELLTGFDAEEIDEIIQDALRESNDPSGAGGDAANPAITASYQVIADCKSEVDQKVAYDWLCAHGYKSRVVTMAV